MAPSVSISCFAESIDRVPLDWAIVAVDIFRATTTAVTCVSTGRRCLLAGDVPMALSIASGLEAPLLIGEVGGTVPPGFHVDNSPALLALRDDVERPGVLTSSSGVPIMLRAARHFAIYAASLRNAQALIEHLATLGRSVAVIGAGTKGQFREEDQLGCAWVAAGLLAEGFVSADDGTAHVVGVWAREPAEAMLVSPSATWLLENGKQADVDFVLDHVNDLSSVIALSDGELAPLPTLVPSPSPA